MARLVERDWLEMDVTRPIDRARAYRHHVGMMGEHLARSSDARIPAALLPLELIATDRHDGIAPIVHVRRRGDASDGAFTFAMQVSPEPEAGVAEHDAFMLADGAARHAAAWRDAGAERRAARLELERLQGLWEQGFSLGQVSWLTLRSRDYISAEVRMLGVRLRMGTERVFARNLAGLGVAIAEQAERHAARRVIRDRLASLGGSFWIEPGAETLLRDYCLSVGHALRLLGGGSSLGFRNPPGDVPYLAAELELADGTLSANFYGAGWQILRDAFYPDTDIPVPESAAAACVGRPFRTLLDIHGLLGDVPIREVTMVRGAAAAVLLEMPRRLHR